MLALPGPCWPKTKGEALSIPLVKSESVSSKGDSTEWITRGLTPAPPPAERKVSNRDDHDVGMLTLSSTLGALSAAHESRTSKVRGAKRTRGGQPQELFNPYEPEWRLENSDRPVIGSH